MLVAVVVQRHFSIPPGPVHRVNVGVEEYLVKVPHDNRQGRQHRFIKVNGGRDVEPPARHVIAHQNLGPQHDAGDGHHDHAPHQSPVFSLFRVVEAGKLRLAGSQAEIIANILPCAPGIVQRGEQIANQFASFAAQRDVEDVVNTHPHEHDCRNAMQQVPPVLAQ